MDKNYRKSARRISCLALGVAVCAAGVFTMACNKDSGSEDKKTSITDNPSDYLTPQKANFEEHATFDNFKEPNKGDEIIVMTIADFGEVKIRLFPDLVPKAVENFVTHAKEGYYDGLTFHRIISGFMIQGGDPSGNGSGGKSIWGEKFDSGMTDRLHHFTGALAYANSGNTATSGSQFYICVNKAITNIELNQYVSRGFAFDEDTQKTYLEKGGQPFLDTGIYGAEGSGYTIFGQVISGQNIIEEVSKVATDDNDRPNQSVKIKSVKVEKYEE